MKSKIYLLARCMATIFILMSQQSCKQRELCYDHSHVSPVSIIFDWSLAPDADPSTMVVWFFPTDGSQGRRFELLRGGAATKGESDFNSVVKLAPGEYNVVCHNGDTENNIEEGNTFLNYSLRTYDDDILSPINRAETAPCPDGCETQPVRSAASTLYAHSAASPVIIPPTSANPVTVTLVPEKVTTECHVTITGVENLVPDVKISAVITGAAEKWIHHSGMPGGTDVMVPFALRHCGTDCLKGDVTLFGVNNRENQVNKLRVYTSYKYYYDFDISDQIRNAPDPQNIYISLSGIKLPSLQDGGGMSPGVNDWGDTVKEEIQM